MENINPFYNRKQDGFSEGRDLFAYIDESGDDNCKVLESEENDWFVVSAIVLRYHDSVEIMKIIKNYMNNHYPNKKLRHMSFKRLKKGPRVSLFGEINKNQYLTINTAFYKPSLNITSHRAIIYPSMYYFGVLDILERISWLTKQFNYRKTHTLISNRNKIDTLDLKQYLFHNSINATANNMFPEKLGQVSTSQIENHPKLLLADYTASSMRSSLQTITPKKVVEKIYFDTFLRGNLYSSNHKDYPGVWSNGIKCIPGNKTLIVYRDILEEGSHDI